MTGEQSGPVDRPSIDPVLRRISGAWKTYQGKPLDAAGFALHDCILDYLFSIGDDTNMSRTKRSQNEEILHDELVDEWCRRKGRPLSDLERDVFKFVVPRVDARAATRHRLVEALRRVEVRGLSQKIEKQEPYITDPEPVIYSRLFTPINFLYRPCYQMATSRHQMVIWNRHSSNTAPLIRDANNAPMTLPEELGAGSVVQVKVGSDGLMAAVRVFKAVWPDPFNLIS